MEKNKKNIVGWKIIYKYFTQNNSIGWLWLKYFAASGAKEKTYTQFLANIRPKYFTNTEIGSKLDSTFSWRFIKLLTSFWLRCLTAIGAKEKTYTRFLGNFRPKHFTNIEVGSKLDSTFSWRFMKLVTTLCRCWPTSLGGEQERKAFNIGENWISFRT